MQEEHQENHSFHLYYPLFRSCKNISFEPNNRALTSHQSFCSPEKGLEKTIELLRGEQSTHWRDDFIPFFIDVLYSGQPHPRVRSLLKKNLRMHSHHPLPREGDWGRINSLEESHHHCPLWSISESCMISFRQQYCGTHQLFCLHHRRDLSNNQLTGKVPTWLSLLTNLRTM